MAVPDGATSFAKWKARTAAAQQDYVDGALSTDKDPTALAIAAGPRYIANVQRSFNDGTWANRLRASGKTGWQNGIRDKGATNFTNGVQNAGAKAEAAFVALAAYIAGVQRQIASMPNVTDADREARMLANTRLMRQYNRSA